MKELTAVTYSFLKSKAEDACGVVAREIGWKSSQALIDPVSNILESTEYIIPTTKKVNHSKLPRIIATIDDEDTEVLDEENLFAKLVEVARAIVATDED